MSCPKVSIIVPVYNTEKYLDRCVSSLANQTLKDIEIILVDDSSPDNCPKMCDDFAADDSRIKVVHKHNEGPGYARNSGLDIATGEYVGFIDSDDYADADMYAVLYNAAKKYEAQLVVSGWKFVGGNMFDTTEIDVREYFEKITLFSDENEINNLMLGIAGALPDEPHDSRYGTSVCKNLFKRDVIEDNNIRFLSDRDIYSEDCLFLLDYSMHITKALGFPGAFYCYCRNGESLSKSYSSTRFEKSMIFVKEVEKRLSSRLSKSTYKIYTDRLTQAFGRILCCQEIVYAKDNRLNYRMLRQRLYDICTCGEIKNALKDFPWYKLPVMQAVFAFLMKYRLYFLQKIIVLLREKR